MQARGDILIFIDSDVVPEASTYWLLFPIADIATRLFPRRMKTAIQL